ncbi:MAG: hypothetical protein LBS45_09690 [Synergistaceae bacterium]|jgi:hypothetical protein|nr:hypothetical protein [Synergistaceae bacterium]
MTQNTYLRTIEEISDYLESAFDGDARALGISPDVTVRGAEILGTALAAWE